jgi:hypothetical protein
MRRNRKIISLSIKNQFPGVKERLVDPSDGGIIPSDQSVSVKEIAFELELELLTVKVP